MKSILNLIIAIVAVITTQNSYASDGEACLRFKNVLGAKSALVNTKDGKELRYSLANNHNDQINLDLKFTSTLGDYDDGVDGSGWTSEIYSGTIVIEGEHGSKAVVKLTKRTFISFFYKDLVRANVNGMDIGANSSSIQFTIENIGTIEISAYSCD